MTKHYRTAARGLAAFAAAALALGTVGLGAAGPAAAAFGYACPGGLFCGWDGAEGTGSMIVQVDANCVLHDIGNGGVGDRLTSYWNRTGQTVDIYNWTGRHWQLLASVPDNGRGTLPAEADNAADAVGICA
ncbi:peptidase inhibitor family I36 protein [Nocardia otitidiscaviarum]|uniref:peptidase inhibitor family I36 protein n=1 Tax=Nocardia otitidiscaviarum TaxID=1823 RepID=UPI000693ED51|nr:peptidase inhibitor family I36 protein [Nocardia otitidiscaviarum]MBF6136434.1 peptidase inhibitor family I36 protein [Nocardia otitidiscaviarum]MBF6484636.1 peptidase inhibitor family I36 protein [Nocardia otitidiscaviarum]